VQHIRWRSGKIGKGKTKAAKELSSSQKIFHLFLPLSSGNPFLVLAKAAQMQ